MYQLYKKGGQIRGKGASLLNMLTHHTAIPLLDAVTLHGRMSYEHKEQGCEYTVEGVRKLLATVSGAILEVPVEIAICFLLPVVRLNSQIFKKVLRLTWSNK